MNQYLYDKRKFLIQVTITGIFCICIAIISVVNMVQGYIPGIMAIVLVASLYTVFNTFVAKSTPEKVTLSDNEVSFESYNNKTVYVIDDIEKFRIREFPTSGKLYIRVNDHNMFKGRYWVQTKMFNDGRELFMNLLDLEYKLHPDSLKARARTVNTEYNEKEALTKKERGKYVRKRKK